jgi:DNA-directed RNA polymerase specialized sigma subunit
MQVAALGLVKAIDRFDPSRETAFSSAGSSRSCGR